MEVTKDMVSYVAELASEYQLTYEFAKTKVTDEQIENARQGLGEIIGYMDVLNNIDTEGVEPMSHAFAVKNVMREDVVKQSADRKELLANAPKSDDEAIIVPKTVE